MYSPKAILVTGAAGFIGSHFVDFCLQQIGVQKVISLDALTYAGDKAHLASAMHDLRHHFVHADINDQAQVVPLMREHNIDTIVHFAAETHVDRSITSPDAFIKTNVVGTFQLLEAARQVWSATDHCRFHHISTDEVYGTLGKTDAAFSEATAYSPNSPYSASKAGADHLVNAYFHTYGLPAVTTNCSNNYGARQCHEKLIPTIINAALNKQPIPIYGDGSNIRDWLYVEDHCHGIWAALTQGELGECYNIGGDCEMSNLSLAQMICQQLDVMSPGQQGSYTDLITFVDDRPGHDWRYAVNHSKLTTLIGWQPVTSVEEGLQKTIAAYQTTVEVNDVIHD
ncbi:MAG: dTDP-glucose 4,6-dehydratase [Coxiella sp. (in: Bacteria)]|nr:MAG: dTDP-glucose 4,6-dehydratase [Coxiella sp. (in: g-proteobacteria)]